MKMRTHNNPVSWLQASSASPSAQSRPQTPTWSRADAHSRTSLTSLPQPALPALNPKLSVPMPKGRAAKASVAGSPSRLSRMTLQDTQAAEEEGESASEPGSLSATLNRAGSVLEGLSDAIYNDHPKQKPEMQLHLTSNAELSHGLSRTASTAAAAVRSPRMMSQELGEETVAKDESIESVVPPWRSNSAAAWVKQKSFTKSLSAKAFPDWDQQEEELQRREQQTEPDQGQAASPHARAGQSAMGPGRTRPLGNLQIEVEEQPQQDGLQDWAESGLDDIAAAVAQYTGAAPDDLLSTEGRQQVEEQNPEQLLQQQQQQQQQRQRPQAASLQLAGFRSATQSPRVEAKRQYATQQEQMDAELEAAMAAEMSGPTYAKAQEQMEAELEAAMAAEISAPKYANAQEQMEADLEAAMAADAAADVAQDERHASESDVGYPEQWQQKNKEVGVVTAAKTSSAAPVRTPLHCSASEGRAGQTLSLPGAGHGLDLDADAINGAQYLQDKMQKVRITPYLLLLCHYFHAVKHDWHACDLKKSADPR